MVGNLLISLYAGVSAFLALLLLGVPSPIVLALFVAFADLIPLVGATSARSSPCSRRSSTRRRPGVIALIFFVIYQQIENGVIYPTVMARKVKVNPLVVLLSVLLGVELFGFLGALLAVPDLGCAAGRREVDRHRASAREARAPPDPSGDASATAAAPR